VSGVLYIVLMLIQPFNPKGVHCHSVAANFLLTDCIPTMSLRSMLDYSILSNQIFILKITKSLVLSCSVSESFRQGLIYAI